MRLIITFIFLSLFLAFGQEKQQYRFKQYDTQNGLTQNSINDIFQDSDGFIWAATQDGISRFDGYEFKQFKPVIKDAYSVSDNFIWSICEDSLGFLWFASRNGLNRMNRYTGQTIKLFRDTTLVNDYVRCIASVGSEIWVSYQNVIFRININNAFSKPAYQLDELKIPVKKETTSSFAQNIIQLSNGKVLLRNDNHLIIHSDNKKQSIPLLKTPSITVSNTDLKQDEKGRIWISDNSGIYYMTDEHSEIREFMPEIFSGKNCRKIAFDEKGYLWVATDSGVFVVNISEKQVSHVTHQTAITTSLSGNSIHSVYKDRQNNMWVGTANKGLNVYYPSIDRFKFLTREEGLNSEGIWSVCYTSKNELWVGTDEGVNIITLHPGKKITSEQFAVSGIRKIETHRELKGKVTRIAEDNKGRMWIGIRGKGVSVLSNNGKLIKHIDFQDKSPNFVTDIVFDSNDNAWITTIQGFFKVDNDLHLVKFKPPFSYFLCAYIDSEGLIWLGHNGGFYRFDPVSEKFEPYLYTPKSLNRSPGFNFITSFYEDKKGNLWSSTYGKGLDKFDRKSNLFTHYNERIGLSNYVCGNLAADKHGNFWISTNDGISCFNAKQETVKNYTVSNGLIFNEIATNSAHSNQWGELFFPTAKGLILFHPDSILQLKTQLSKPSITGVYINYEYSEINTVSPKKFTFSHEDKVISFEFSSFDFAAAENTVYAFKLSGIDPDWVYTASPKRTATYSTLPSGNYTFMLKAKLKNGEEWSETLTIDISISPPFWLTWWFIGLIILILILLILFFLRFSVRNKVKRQSEQLLVKEKIQRERVRISRDLHDNLGSSITYIISSLDRLVWQEKTEKKDLTNKMNELSDFARSTMSQLRETIWVIDNDSITLYDLKSRIIEYVALMTTDSGIKYAIKIPDIDISIDSNRTIHLYRIIQEAVNNSVKHSNAGKLEIYMDPTESYFELTISDNGTGFDFNKISANCMGLKNIHQRCKEIEGICTIDTEKNKGTTICIKFSVL